MRYYIVDAFAKQVFSGNQAGVCLLDGWPGESVMQNIASENNLAETAFVVPEGDHYELRWFTPKVEMDLCGHATLASAFVITEFVDRAKREVRFQTKSGLLTVTKTDGLYEMDFPSRKPKPVPLLPKMNYAIGLDALEAHAARDLLLLVQNEEQVRTLEPNWALMKEIDQYFAVVVTSRGNEVDFVSRFFAPNAGVPEDPVTGSSHSTLIPFWSERLAKAEMTARQLSKRGGELYCRDAGDRVKIGGYAALYLEGSLHV